MEAHFPDGRRIQFSLQSAPAVGRGATAAVYFAIVGDKSYAAKIYKDPSEINLEKISYMSRIGGPQAGFKVTFAWPLAIIYEGAAAIGYLMPIFDKGAHYPLNYYFDTTLSGRLVDVDTTSLSNRVEIANSLCTAIAALHDQSTFFIDLKPQNVLINWRTNGVGILDCDGFSIRSADGRTFKAGHVSTDYIAPEVTREHLPPSALGAAQDNYALAVVLFQMFNYAQHPFQGTPLAASSRPFTTDELAAEGMYPYGLTPNPRISPRQGSTHHCLPNEMRLLFDRSFIGHKDHRVQPREWCALFSDIIVRKELQKCSRFPNSVQHIHFRNAECPACYRDVQFAKLKSVKPSKPGSSTPTASVSAVSPAQITSVTQQKNSSLWKWVAGAAIGISLIYVSNSGESRNSSTQTSSPSSVTTTTPSSPKVTSLENPTDMSEVNPNSVITDVVNSEFRPYKNSNSGTFTVYLPQGTQISLVKNPALFLAPGDCVPSQAEVVNAQKVLADIGYRVGIFDGILGPATTGALKEYQRKQLLPVTGQLDWKTAERLNVYVAAFDLKRFKYHSRGSVFSSASGPIVRFLGVNSDLFCYYVTRS